MQTGVHRSIIFGEVFGDRSRISPRVQALADVLARRCPGHAGGHARVPIWDKFVYLVPFSGFTGSARLSIGYLWQNAHQEMFYGVAKWRDRQGGGVQFRRTALRR